jgi:predicted dehydrogenase
MTSVRFGIIGLGMGAVHLQACLENPRAEITAICDSGEARLREVAASRGIPFAAADYHEIVSRDDVDAVVVASPDFLHAEHSVAAMEAGKHVLCEKPLALTLADCRAMIDAADRTGMTFMVGQVCRFAPGFVRAKELIDAGAIGELFLVESEYAHDYTNVPGVGGWRRDPAHPREPVIGGGCHAVDLLRWLAGEPVEVDAYANHRVLTDWPVDDCTVAILRFESGVVGRLMVSIGSKRAYTMRSAFYGTRGTVICDNTSPTLTLFTDDESFAPDEARGSHHFTVPIEVPVGRQEKAVPQEIDHFVDCVLGQAPVAMGAREGARTVAVCLAIVEAAHTGRRVLVTRIPIGSGRED